MQRCLPLLLDWLLLFPHFIVGRFFSFRSAFLSLGSGDNCVDLFGWCSGCSFRLEKKDFLVVLLLSLLRAVTSFSCLQHIRIQLPGWRNHSFYVSVGGISSYDVLLSGKEIPLGDVCGLHVRPCQERPCFHRGNWRRKMVIRQSDWQQLVFLCFPMRGILLAYE